MSRPANEESFGELGWLGVILVAVVQAGRQTWQDISNIGLPWYVIGAGLGTIAFIGWVVSLFSKK